MQFFKHLTDPALKRLYKFVLKRMIGRFLAADELDLDQLDVHLRSGRLELCDLLLNADVLNAELCEAQGLPFRVEKGYLGSVRVAISYAKIMNESCLVEIDDVEIVLVPLNKAEVKPTASSDAEQTEAGEQEQEQEDSGEAKRDTTHEEVDEISREGLDFVASWIEQVTSKIKVTLSNVCLRLETGEQHNGRDVALLCRLQWAQFTDESASEVMSVYGRGTLDHPGGMCGSQTMGGGMQSMAASTLFGISHKGIKFRDISMSLHLSGEESGEAGRWNKRCRTEYSDMALHPFLASDPSKQCYIQVKISHYEAFEAPAMDADIFFHSIRVVLQPQYFPELAKILDAFSTDATEPNTHHLEERYSSTATFRSICENRPGWMTGGDDDRVDGGDKAIDLSFKEFQRIEQLLLHYRQTQDKLKNAHRDGFSTGGRTSPAEEQLLFTTGRLSAVESVDSIGLSDLDNEDDGFFECDSGLASSIAPSASFGNQSMMGQSMYTSARYGFNESDTHDDRSQLSSSTTAAQHQAAHRVQSRTKVHLLECQCVFLYDDMPDDDDEVHENVPSGQEGEGMVADSRVPRASIRPKKAMPCVDGLERLELSLKDTIFSSLAYSQHSLLAFSIGTCTITEKTFPRMSLGAEEDEAAMLSTCILRCVDTSPVSGRRANLSANLSAQVRIDFEPESDDRTSAAPGSLGLRVNVQPVLVEWDMYLVDRAHRLLALLEDDSTVAQQKVRDVDRRNEAQNFVKTLDVTTECVQMTLRFPMVNSDLIRFGPSSKRGLCEDRLVMTLEGVKVISTSPRASAEDGETFVAGSTPMPPQYRKGCALPWLGEFDTSFDNVKVSLWTPENGNQRSARLGEAVIITAYSDKRNEDVCTLRLRLQSPSREDMEDAVAGKKILSQDSSQSPDGASVNSSPDDVGGDDNDGGRVGLNGWNLDALGRTESYERAAAAASLYSVEIGLPIANAVLFKSSLDRLMVLFDALLMINPIDVDSYNEMLAAAALRNRLLPCYMSMNLTLGEGTLRVCDYIPLPSTLPAPASVVSNGTGEKTSDQSESDKVLFTYHFAFQTLKVFQVSQWMGQLISRVHVLAQNTTLLEEDGREKAIVPIVYRTPFGTSKAPIWFMGVDIADQTNAMREMKVDLHLSHLSLRYNVRSKWLFQLLDMVLMDYPVPIIPLDSASMSDEESTKLFEMTKDGRAYDVVPLATASKTVFTKLFVNCYDVTVDYAPLTLTSRVILVLGTVSVSSNVVTGAVMQGFKLSVGDPELFLTQARPGYEEIDAVLLGNDIFLRSNTKGPKKNALTFTGNHVEGGGGGTLGTEYPSLPMFLEKFGFLQIVTMDFVDVFLRVLVAPSALEVASAHHGRTEKKEPASSASAELSMELNLGTANVYACFDSFNTLIELLSVWADQLAIEQGPRDTTAYVGLDGSGDPSGISVVTNLSPAPAKIVQPINAVSEFVLGSQGVADFCSSSSVRNDRFPVGDSGASGDDSVNILEQIDEAAFGNGKKIFPGRTIASDTEARLLRTRMDAIQREKNRMVHDFQHDDHLSASELRLRYEQDERSKSTKPVRINELVIEDYYSETRSIDKYADESAGAFLMEPLPNDDHPQGATAGSDPWFSPPVGSVPNYSIPLDSTSKKSAVPYNGQATRWLASGGSTGIAGESEECAPGSKVPGIEPSLFDPVEEKLYAPPSAQHMSPRASAGETTGICGNTGAANIVDDVDFDVDQLSIGAYPAASKNWWGMQNRLDDVELSDLQTEETASSFSHRMDLLEEKRVDHQASAEVEEEQLDGANLNGVYCGAMSMSIIGAGEDEGKEIELDFALDSNLQSRLNRLLDMESNSECGTGDQGSDDRGSDTYQNDSAYQRSGRDEQQHGFSVASRPCAIPTQGAPISSTSSHQEDPSSFRSPTISPLDEPTARWFYDDRRFEDGVLPMTGPPSRIYPHHVEIPIGGSATSLSFGEKECEDAIRSIARENTARKVEAPPPIVVRHMLLRNLNIRVRFFGGCDWTRDVGEAVKLHSRKDVHSTEENMRPPGSATARKEKLLDALLDNYVPSDGGDLFGDESSSPLFDCAKSAPSTSYMKRDSAARTTRAALSDRSHQSRKRVLKKSSRKTEEMLELVVTRIQFRLDMFNEAEAQSLASHSVLALGDVELLDYISTSQIRKIVCYWKSEATHPRESGSSMVRLQLTSIRPGANLCEEHRLKARLLPLRINLDQEVVKFLRQFVPVEDPLAPKSPFSARQQVEGAEDDAEMPMHEHGVELKQIGESLPALETNVRVGAWFFQSIDIKPCKIKIDYRPNHVDYAALRAGDYLEVINLFVLEGMELMLRRVQMSGLDGWTALGEHVLVSWVQDISRRQIHKCVASVSMPPLRPFVNIGAGAADLILLPMEHYGRDRRLVRGMKKGASSFLRSVTIETLNTASKVARGTQALLEHADDVMSSSSALRRKQLKYRQAGSRIARNSRRLGGGGIRNAQDTGGGIGGRQYLTQQPATAAEGFGQAYDSLARELHVAAKTIVAVPLIEYKKTGSQGYVRSVIRAVPVAVLRPMIGASEAMAKALIGVRNAVDPELKEDIENKFKDFRAI